LRDLKKVKTRDEEKSRTPLFYRLFEQKRAESNKTVINL